MTSVNTSSGKLWSCVMAHLKPSKWQHENLEGVIKYGTTIRRQPTKTEFKRIKKLLFTSRKLLSTLWMYAETGTISCRSHGTYIH